MNTATVSQSPGSGPAAPHAHAALANAGGDAAARADCYRVLARLFAAPPDAALLAALASAAPGAADGDDALGRAWNALRETAAKVGAGGTASAAALLRDAYTELFCGIGEPRVMLYGSWYLSGSLMDMPLARLRDDLARLGIARDPQVREPEDHVGALLEVMAMLAEANPADDVADAAHAHSAFSGDGLAGDGDGDGVGANDDALTDAMFFQRHLAPWYAQLCRRLEAEDSPFYRAVARFARAYLDAENACLEAPANSAMHAPRRAAERP